MSKSIGIVKSKLSLKIDPLKSIIEKNKAHAQQMKKDESQNEIKEGDPQVKPEEEEYEIKSFDQFEGKGRVISSARAVHGKETKFLSEVKVGDSMTVFNSTKLIKETRIVIVILSDISLGLKEPFSSNIGAFTKYEIKPRDVKLLINAADPAQQTTDDVTLGKRNIPEVNLIYKAMKDPTFKHPENDRRDLEAEYKDKWKLKRDKWCT